MKLTSEQIEHFFSKGYLVVEDVFSPADLAPVINAIDEFIAQRALELKEQGKIQDLCEGQPFERRFASLYAQSKEIETGIDIMQCRLEELYKFLFNDKLLDLAESLLGGELLCSPVQHLRAKIPTSIIAQDVPHYVHNVPWHQDAAVTLEDADPYDIFNFWIPLVDAVKETGCMEVLPEAFKAGLLTHQNVAGLTIVPSELPAITPQPVPSRKGGVVILNKYTPHRGLPNLSNIVRWSLDLRYQKAGTSTGRSFYPEFIVRNREQPEKVQPDYRGWSEAWIEALEAHKDTKKYRSLIKTQL
jgi:phytanoyl-CoA hydroxylase